MDREEIREALSFQGGGQPLATFRGAWGHWDLQVSVVTTTQGDYTVAYLRSIDFPGAASDWMILDWRPGRSPFFDGS